MPLDITLSEKDIKRIRGSDIDCPSCAILRERIEEAKAGEALLKLIQKAARTGGSPLKSEAYIEMLRNTGYTIERIADEAQFERDIDNAP